MRGRVGIRSIAGATALFLVILAIAGCAGGTSGATSTPTKPTGSAAFANPDLLVNASWLSGKLSDTKVRIVDARTPAEYKAGHIQGAVNIPVEDTFNPEGPKQMAGPPEQEKQLFGQKGIGKETKVVVYDNGKETKASRLFWTLEYYGKSNVSVLDGGFKKWQQQNLATSTEETKVTAADFAPKANPALLAAKADVLAAIDKPGMAIVDSRSPQEFSGQDLRAKRGGHIPGAVNINWTDLFTGDDPPVLKSPADLKKMYEDAGVTKDKKVIAHCQTGQRSSVTYLTLRLLGYDNVRNYDGSWQEWGNDPDVPIKS